MNLQLYCASSDKAEVIEGHMINVNRMVGSIDQMEQLISFESGGAARDEKVGGEHTLVAAAANGSSSQPTRRIGCSLFGHPYNQWRPVCA